MWFESLGARCRRVGLCFRNCSCGCSQIHSDEEYGTDFSQEQLAVWVLKQTVHLFEQLCCNGVYPATLEHLQPCQVGLEQVRVMTTGCKSTVSTKAWERVKANTQIRKSLAQATQMSTLASAVVEPGHWVKDCWRQVQEHTSTQQQ